MKYAWVCVLAVLVIPSAQALLITEVHADPLADESLNEWIEIYNNDLNAINISGWHIGDIRDNDTLLGAQFGGQGVLLQPLSFAIITDETTRVYENFNVSSDALHLYIDDDSLGNGLSNDGEQLFLYFQDILNTSITYPSTQTARSASWTNNTWSSQIPSPGTFSNGTGSASCDYEVQILLDKSIFESQDEFSWKLIARKIHGPATSISSQATIEDFYGNIEQTYTPFTEDSITTQKTSSTYSPNLDEGKSYIVSASIATACPDTNEENNVDERIFTIQDTLDPDSTIRIMSIQDLGSDKTASFGQSIRIQATIYRGNTTKESIAAWVENTNHEKISKQAKATIETQFTETTLTIPLQLIPNCKSTFKDGKYKVILDGLETDDEESITIRGLSDELCPNEPKLQPAVSSTFSAQLQQLPSYAHNEQSTATLRLDNPESNLIEVDVWSYIYRSSTSYSGQRESNKKHLTIQPQSTLLIELSNTPMIKEQGSYKIKFLILPSTRKTPIDITKDILITKPTTAKENTIKSTSPSSNTSTQASKASITGAVIQSDMQEVVFSSSSQKAQDAALYVLIGALALLSVTLIVTKS